MGGHTLNAVVCVQVLVHRNLEQRRSSLTVDGKHIVETKLGNNVIETKQGKTGNVPSDNDRPCKEEEPNAVEPESSEISLTSIQWQIATYLRPYFSTTLSSFEIQFLYQR